MKRKNSLRSFRRERVGDWETFDGSTVGFAPGITPASQAPPVWGATGSFTIAPGNFVTWQIAALMPSLQTGVVIPVGRAYLAEIEASFDVVDGNAALTSGYSNMNAVIAAGIYRTRLDVNAPAWPLVSPFDPRAWGTERMWITHKEETFWVPDHTLLLVDAEQIRPVRCPRITVTAKGRFNISQGETVAITVGLDKSVPISTVQLANVRFVPFVRAKFCYVV
jgi:hypothetical protein